MKSPQRALMLATAFVVVAGCNKGIQLAEVPSMHDNSSLGTGSNGGTVTGPTASGWESIKYNGDGRVAGSSFDGQMMIEVDSVNQALILLVPVPFPSLLIPVDEFDLSQVPGAKVFQATDSATGNTSIAIRMPLKYMLRGTTLTPSTTLPNGDALMGMPGDTRGFSIAFPGTPEIKLNMYFGANAAAAFIEIPALKLPDEWLKLALQFPVRDASGTQTLGNLAFVPNKGAFNAGVYVSSRLPNYLAQAIGEVLR